MLIPPSFVKERPAADAWRDIYITTWWLTVLVTAGAFFASPLDFFPSADPLDREIGVGDRIANSVVVILAQNVVLLMILFAAHVVRSLEELVAQGKTSPAVSSPTHPPRSAPQQATNDDPRETPGIWYCAACQTKNGQFDVNCWRCGKAASGGDASA